jgi:hypothetical protein
LFCEGFQALRGVENRLLSILEVFRAHSPFDCFSNFKLDEFKSRFASHIVDIREVLSLHQLKAHIAELMVASEGSTMTTMYDLFQKYTNNIEV